MTERSDEQPSNSPPPGRPARAGAATVPASPAAADTRLTVRPMTHADIPGGLRLCRESGWNQVARDWAQFLTLGPEGARVAVRGDRVVGTAATIRHDARFAWIGMVLVDPAERGRGIGTLMLKHSLEILADMPAVRLDATPAGHGIYLRNGFIEEYRLSRLRATVPPGLAAPPTGRVRPAREADLADVIAFDERVFGANRAAMLRWMWEGAPEYAWIAHGPRGRLEGYAFGRHGFLFEHLGPVVAVDEARACELAAACLAPHAGREFIVDAAQASEWLRYLEESGFREQRILIRMCRGQARGFGDPSRQFAVLGPEFG